ncbi:MAG TPA: ABC transporter substrate-binding protein [Candidatus Binatia bacterium]|jgi:polar amino acid transport system substrate-binding protein
MTEESLHNDLAPTGKLRVGINYGNPVLATRDPASGGLRGVAVDLARELGRRTALPVELVGFDAAGKMFEALKMSAWDVAFLAIDPERSHQIDFTAAYIEIEGTYLVPAGSPFKTIEEIDRENVRVGISAKSAYDLFLSRTMQHATLVRASGPDAAFELLMTGQVDVLAGVKQHLVANAVKLPGSRVLPGRFMAIEQALGIPKGRSAGAKYLRKFIEDVKASSLVAQAIERAGVEGVSVAPPARSDV